MNTVNIDQLSADDPVRVLGQQISDKFTEMVDCLRTFPNDHLAMLGRLVWRLVGNRVIQVTFMEVPTISFAVARQSNRLMGMVICPNNWLDQVKANPNFCMGGLVFVGSQCRDFWNGKLGIDSRIMDRADAYEAEYLLNSPSTVLSAHEAHLIQRYPKGLDSVRELIYEGKPYMDAK